MDITRSIRGSAMSKSNTTRLAIGLIIGSILIYSVWHLNSGRNRDETTGEEDVNELFAEKLPAHLKNVGTLYVIPGGGSGAGVDNVKNHYPEWTRRRVSAAYEHSKHDAGNRKEPLFLALSAGSLNTPNSAHEDGRIKFECQHMIEHLVVLGVPRYAILGDFMSWDTITNALYLRMVINGVKVAQNKNLRNKKMKIEVFISDFHAERVQAAFTWVLGLRPSLLPYIDLTINTVSSEGIIWPNEDTFKSRIEHEAKGVAQIKANEKMVKSVQELHAFLLLGLHQGFFNYMHHQLPGKTGGGW